MLKQEGKAGTVLEHHQMLYKLSGSYEVINSGKFNLKQCERN